ncbi:PREDICTED: uncharacterized protein LOC101297808 [Fragaria vesca subsp. vesca]
MYGGNGDSKEDTKTLYFFTRRRRLSFNSKRFYRKSPRFEPPAPQTSSSSVPAQSSSTIIEKTKKRKTQPGGKPEPKKQKKKVELHMEPQGTTDDDYGNSSSITHCSTDNGTFDLPTSFSDQILEGALNEFSYSCLPDDIIDIEGVFGGNDTMLLCQDNSLISPLDQWLDSL